MNVPVSNLRQQILNAVKGGRPAEALPEVERATVAILRGAARAIGRSTARGRHICRLKPNS